MTTAERLRSSTDGHAPRNTNEKPRLGEFGCCVAGQWIKTGDLFEVRSPFDDSLLALVHRAGHKEIEAAISKAKAAFDITRRLPSWKRSEILEKISAGIAARRDEFAQTIALEAGKPIRTARVEADRAVFVFKIAAEETKRIYGEVLPLDWLPGTEGREAQVRRVPLGRLKLAEIVLAAGWPSEAFSVVPSTVKEAAPLIEDDRISLLTFTGSPAVGWSLKSRAGRKRVTLELGGNAGVIVHKDADVAYAAERVAWGGFSYAGQSCISVQRVYVHADVHDKFVNDFVARVKALKTGDPLEESTDVGPLIDPTAAERVEEWVVEAQKDGATLLAGGSRSGNLFQPTVLSNITPKMRVSCQEVFAPVVVIYRYSNIEDAIAGVDESDFGLQAGLFTNDLKIIKRAFDDIDVGGLMVNDVSTFRIDHMPYGGVKHSGFGREGLRYAMEEMSDLKLLTFNYH